MDAVEEIKSRLAIEDVIGEYVQLKRAGRNWRGLSPFSSEKTPSFMVSPEKQIWHDFSSGKGGNMFSFVMEMEGLDFKGALELLARKAGVDLEQYRKQGQRRGPNKEKLFEVLEAAARFYQVQFSKNKTALKYVLGKRGFTKETALTWRLGYAPNTGRALLDFLASKDFKESDIKAAGLSAQRYSKPVDMFRGRLMIPLQDPQGRVVGFTARLLDDSSDGPKYINTPATVLYDKSRHVYGLHLAKEAIRKKQFVVLVEGNLDVIASHQAGVHQVVATAGTALTEQHLKALSRFTGDIRLSFDQDQAGLKATERAIPIASRVKVSLGIIDVPSGKDPDELIKQDPKVWQEIIDQPQYALDWLIERYEKLLNTKSAQGKREFSDMLLPVVKGLSDAVEQDHYLTAIAEKIDVSKEALTSKFGQTSGSTDKQPALKHRKTSPAQIDRAAAENTKVQNHFLSLTLLRPGLREYLEPITPDMFSGDPEQTILKFLKDNPDFAGDPAQAKELNPVAENVKIILLQYEELYQGLELSELRYEAARLQARLIENFVKNKKQILVAQLQEADDQATQTILTEVKRLDLLLKQIAGGGYGEER
jgi:DNA primase